LRHKLAHEQTLGGLIFCREIVFVEIFDDVLPLVDVVFYLGVLEHLAFSYEDHQKADHEGGHLFCFQIDGVESDSNQRDIFEALLHYLANALLCGFLFLFFLILDGVDIAFDFFLRG